MSKETLEKFEEIFPTGDQTMAYSVQFLVICVYYLFVILISKNIVGEYDLATLTFLLKNSELKNLKEK